MKIKTVKILIGLMLILPISMAYAEDLSIVQLFSTWQAFEENLSGAGAYCYYGSANGVYDINIVLLGFPLKLSSIQLSEIVRKYLREHPEDLHKYRDPLVTHILIRGFLKEPDGHP